AGYLTAWFRSTLSGDTTARGAFAGSAPELPTNTAWTNFAAEVDRRADRSQPGVLRAQGSPDLHRPRATRRRTRAGPVQRPRRPRARARSSAARNRRYCAGGERERLATQRTGWG